MLKYGVFKNNIYAFLQKIVSSSSLRFIKRVKRAIIKPSMKKVLLELTRRGVTLHTMQALEIFGGSGENTAVIFYPYVAKSEVWEINPDLEITLRRNLPRTTIKIADSYQELAHSKNKYDLIIADNSIYHPDFSGHVEHFDIFPHVFKIMNDNAILIFNIVPIIDNHIMKYYPWWLDETHFARRKDFYKTENPRDITKEYLRVYKDIINNNGFELEWYFEQRRELVYLRFLILKLRRIKKN